MRVYVGTRAYAICVCVQVIAEQRPPSTPAAGSGQAYDSAVSVGSVGLQVVEGLAVLAAVPAILTARELFLGSGSTGYLCKAEIKRAKCLPVVFSFFGVRPFAVLFSFVWWWW